MKADEEDDEEGKKTENSEQWQHGAASFFSFFSLPSYSENRNAEIVVLNATTKLVFLQNKKMLFNRQNNI